MVSIFDRIFYDFSLICSNLEFELFPFEFTFTEYERSGKFYVVSFVDLVFGLGGMCLHDLGF